MRSVVVSVVRRPRRVRLVRAWLELAGSDHFDAAFYRRTYPDAAGSGDPLLDYLESGWRAGREPSAHFVTSDYLARRPEVAAAGINPLLHYVRAERAAREGRGAERLARAALRHARWLLRRLGPESRIVGKEGSRAARFARRYALAAASTESAPAGAGSDTAVPVDHVGVLSPPEHRPPGGPSVDVVVCVHDALPDLRRCLSSLIEKTARGFHLIVVDDGSGPETEEFLRRFASANEAAELIRRAGPAHGYTLAANDGVSASTGDYVVLLNSDTVVTFGWLERIVACGESDAAIGLVGPLSNAASHQSVPMLREAGAWAVNELPPFLTPDGVAYLVGRMSARSYPRLPFLNGFCYAIKREVIDAVGLFDAERFASGYCEENDYSYRASLAGFELAVADDAYVYHSKSRSYGVGARREIARRNYEIFLDKHGRDRIEPLVASLDRNESLAPLREAVGEAIADEGAFARAFRTACPDPVRVCFVLHGIGNEAAGGVHSIYQEVQGMRALGIDARVLVPDDGLVNLRRRYPDADAVFAGFADEEDLHDLTRDGDVLVATHFASVALVGRLQERREGILPAYYVQDYEPFFFDDDSDEARQALASYTAVPGQLLFAKTHWLRDLVGASHRVHVAKVEPSIDHTVFRPPRRPNRRLARREPLRVVGMVRPRTPRRQPLGTLRILDRVQSELGPGTTVAAFGCDAREYSLVSPRRAAQVENLGLLTRGAVAGVLADADVFLDFSTYQAFGRTALEAMACGCVPVVPELGGADEFAVHGDNAYVIDTSSEDAAFEAIAELVSDRGRLRRMQERGIETARGFSVLRAALSEYVLLAHEHARRGERAHGGPQVARPPGARG